MQKVSVPTLIMRRLASDWTLLSDVLSRSFAITAALTVGFTVAITLIAGAPVYLDSLEQLAFNTSLEKLPGPFMEVRIFASRVRLTPNSVRDAEQSLANAIDRHISQAYVGHEGFLKNSTYLVGHRGRPLPEAGQRGAMVSRGYFQYLSNLSRHSRFLDGRMAGSGVSDGPQGPVVEVVIGAPTVKSAYFDLIVGDVLPLTPDLAAPTQIWARIVGIFEPRDPTEEYWAAASIFLDPSPLTADADPPPVGVQVDPEEPPVPLFVTQEAMAEAVGRAYPGTMATPYWTINLDKERLTRWSLSETLDRLNGFEDEMVSAMPGSSVITGPVRGLVSDIERRVFFSKAPLLMLLALMAVVALFLLFVLASFLVESRGKDVGTLKKRGVGAFQLVRVHALEGLMMTGVAVALAPFLALGAVALAGKLPYFSDMTGGGLLPVHIGPAPFLMSLGAGLLCLSIFVIPGAMGAWGGLLARKLRSSLPPTAPLFHRYYLDIALLFFAGLVFWEIRSKGHLISGGLFEDVQINETLLFAPVLFLIVVALVFLRLFPLVVRFVSGESPALLHLVAAAAVLALAPGIAVRETQEGDGLAWLVPVVLVLATGLAYWATSRAQRTTPRLAGLVLQAGLVAGFLALEPVEPDHMLFAPTVALIAIVPAQVAFLVLKALIRVTPVWVSLGLWRMARNPLQYAWLVLLLVLVTGLGILATTVGATLERSQEERILYEVAADIRVSGIPRQDGGVQGLKQAYLATPGVAAASAAFRTSGSVGPASVQVLALESREFARISWYRDDFSARPLADIMRSLQSDASEDRMVIPDGATTIGAWIRPHEAYLRVTAAMVIEDGYGALRALPLGEMGQAEWHLVSADIPSDLKQPLALVSVQITESGRVRTTGTIYLDDIHVTVGPGNEAYVLDDFEGQTRWAPILGSAFASDSITTIASDAHRGRGAGAFSFGQETVQGIRGFYRSPTAGPLPIVVSSPLVAASGHDVGDTFTAVVAGRRIPVVIRDKIRYFPTLSPNAGMFVVADLDSLLGHLKVLTPGLSVRPNEVFLAKAPASGRPAVQEAVSAMVGLSVRVDDSSLRLDEIRLDPLGSAGWRAIVLISLGIVLLVAVSGYVAYLLSFSKRGRGDMGFLQTLGLSRPQLVGLLGFEHLAIVAIGLGLGTWAGIEMSRLMVSPMAVTERGEPVIPPFILMTDWDLMLPTYGALIGVFSVASFLLYRHIRRLDLHAIARTGDHQW